MQTDINYFYTSVTAADASEESGSVLRHRKQFLWDYLQQSIEGEVLQTIWSLEVKCILTVILEIWLP